MRYKQTWTIGSALRRLLFGSVLGLIALIALSVTGCGGAKPSFHPMQPEQAGSLQEAIADVQNADVPTGVDAALFAELTAELVRVIKAAAEKGAAIPPTGDYNAITDLILLGNDTDGWRLEWTYRNTGDYNLDGMVNVSDLTPIGQNFSASSADENWSAARLADGNGDGMVTVNDITPIGQNFQAFIAGFAIRGADDPEGPWTDIDTIDLPSPLDLSLELSYALASKDYGYYQVAPIDGEETEGDPSWPSLVTLSDPQVTLGEDTPVDTGSIGDSGGTLTGPDLGDGPITISIPAGALAAACDFELGSNDGQVTRDGEDLGGDLVYLTCNEFIEFAEPALITIPLPDDDESFPSGFRILRNGALAPLELLSIDREADSATFALDIAFPRIEHQTSQATDLPVYVPELWFIREVLVAALSESDYDFTTDFDPIADGFGTNYVFSDSDFTVPIEVGMCPFSIWYYHNYRSSMGPLGHFTFNVQGLIALRATTSVWIGTSISPFNLRGSLGRQDHFKAIKQALVASNGPVFVYCADSPYPLFEYYAVAYGYVGDELLIYRPAQPMQRLRFNALEGNNYARLIATDRFPMYEPFENILLDATADPPFGGSKKATITVTSHNSGDTVDSESVKLEGYIDSGAVLIEEMFALSLERAEQKPQFSAVPVTGEFSVDLLLAPGKNQLLFITRGYFDNFAYRPEPFMMVVPNNLGYESFHLNYETAATKGNLAGTIVDSWYGNEQENVDLAVQDWQTHVEVFADSVSTPFAVELDPGFYFARFSRSDYDTVEFPIRIYEGSTVNLEVKLKKKAASRIFGHVWEIDGVTWNQPELWKPLGGVEITWTHDLKLSWPGIPLPPQFCTTADGSGAYSLAPVDGFRMDGSWRFSAVKAGYHEDYLSKCSLPAPDLAPLSWTGVEMYEFVDGAYVVRDAMEIDLLLKADE